MVRILLLTLSLFSSTLAFAQESNPQPTADETLRVATRELPPFSFKAANGEWTGLAVDLWRHVARENDFTFEFIETDNVTEILEGIEQGRFDVGVSGITITPEREERLDFSHPYISSTLGIAYAQDSRNHWFEAFMQIFSLKFLQVMVVLVLVLMISGFLLWIFERKANPDQFPANPSRGIFESFWWAAVTMTTVGYGDKAPVSVGGRFIALIWMFASVIILSTFTAAIVSSLGTEDRAKYSALHDLPPGKVITIEGTTSDDIVNGHHLNPRRTATIEEGMQELHNLRDSAFVYDLPTLTFYTREHAGRIRVTPLPRYLQDYGIAISKGSELRTDINVSLLQLMRSDSWQPMKARYFGE